MAIHRELFSDLPPAEQMLAMYAEAFKTAKNADGYYVLVQYIAEEYGEKAYELAEEVFREMGLKYDPAALRKHDTVRRTGYNMEGPNIYDVHVKPFDPAMAEDVVRLYNAQIRLLSRQAIMDQRYFQEKILPNFSKGMLVACDGGGQVVGFVHCWIEPDGEGSVEALIFSHGRIYDPASKVLVEEAKTYFAEKDVRQVKALQGKVPYPFYQAVPGDMRQTFADKLPHIERALREIV